MMAIFILLLDPPILDLNYDWDFFKYLNKFEQIINELVILEDWHRV